MPRKTTDINKFPTKKGDTPSPYVKTYTGFNPITEKNSNRETDPFRSLINEWLDSCKADGLSLKTIEDYRDKLFKFWWWDNNFASALGKHPCNVTTREARAFAAYLRESVEGRWGISTATNNKFRQSQQLSPVSIAAYGRSAKVFFNWLEREGYIEQTPFNKSVKFTNRHKQDHVLKNVSAENIKSIFSVLVESQRLGIYEGIRNLAIIAMLLDTGMRRGELLSLKLKDLVQLLIIS